MAPGSDDEYPVWVLFTEGSDRDTGRATLRQQELLCSKAPEVHAPYNIAARHLAFDLAHLAQAPVCSPPALIRGNRYRPDHAIARGLAKRIRIALHPHGPRLLRHQNSKRSAR